jgi:hypothetical protein
MIVIKNLDDGTYFKGLVGNYQDPEWTVELSEAMTFVDLEEEESYRSLHLAAANAQPETI